MSVTVIRLSSLGDVVLTGAVTAQIGNVQLVTKRRYVEIAERISGVSSVFSPDNLPQSNLTIDLQNSLFSRKLARQMNAPTRRVKRWDWTRRSRVWFKTAPPPLVVQRYATAAGVEAHSGPWIELPVTDQGLAMFPFSQHRTKSWLPQRFVALGKRWRGTVWLIGSYAEQAALNEMATLIGPSARVAAHDGFDRCLAALSKTHVAVGNDSGWLHIAAATGRPVVGIFGATTSQDGFWCHEGEAIEQDLACRPCSRYGGHKCSNGSFACLEQITVEVVWQGLMQVDPQCAG